LSSAAFSAPIACAASSMEEIVLFSSMLTILALCWVSDSRFSCTSSSKVRFSKKEYLLKDRIINPTKIAIIKIAVMGVLILLFTEILLQDDEISTSPQQDY